MRPYRDRISTHQPVWHRISHNMNMKLTTLFAAAFARSFRFVKTASAVISLYLPPATDGKCLIGQKSGHRSGGQYPAAGVFCRGVSGCDSPTCWKPTGVDTFLPKGGTIALNIPAADPADTVHEGIIINSAENAPLLLPERHKHRYRPADWDRSS